MLFQKSSNNSYFTRLDDIKPLKKLVGLRGSSNDTRERYTEKLLEAIIKNQEHLYEQQTTNYQSMNKTLLNMRDVLGTDISSAGWASRFAILALCAFTLIPMCSRQKEMYRAFQKEQSEKTLTMPSSSFPSSDFSQDYLDSLSKKTYPLYALPR